MYQTDKCVVAQVLKVVVIINLIIIDHSIMIQAFRIIEISKYDDGGQLTTRSQLMQGSSTVSHRNYYSFNNLSLHPGRFVFVSKNLFLFMCIHYSSDCSRFYLHLLFLYLPTNRVLPSIYKHIVTCSRLQK